MQLVHTICPLRCLEASLLRLWVAQGEMLAEGLIDRLFVECLKGSRVVLIVEVVAAKTRSEGCLHGLLHGCWVSVGEGEVCRS